MKINNFGVVFLILSLLSCSDQSKEENQNGGLSNLTIPIPISITAKALSSGNLKAYVTCDVNQNERKPVDEINSNTGRVIATCAEIDLGEHSFRIEFEFESMKYGKTFVLATAQKSLNVVPGSNTLQFLNSEYKKDYDDDNDNLTNLDELNSGTDPTNPDTQVPDYLSITPPNNSILSASNQIVVVFDENMDTASSSLTLGGSMGGYSDGGAWSSGALTNDTLTIVPTSIWPDGPGQTISILVKDLAGNSASWDFNFDIDATVPAAANINISNGATIGQAQTIIINFSEAMDNTTLSISGDMAGESSSTWSTDQNASDTLSIAPSVTWSNGIGRSLIIDVADLAGNALATLNLNFSIDANSPMGTANPNSGTIINASQVITVTFNKAMDITSTSLSGSMAAESNGGVWSSSQLSNNTLTISPNTTWSSGGQTLLVNASDPLGNSAAIVSLNYSVDGQAPTVSSINIESGSVISTSQAIELIYNESMDTGSLSLSGSMIANSDNGIWSTSNANNDTLTISPTNAWNSGAGTIVVNASDLLGNSAIISLDYSVDTTPASYSVNVDSGSTIPGNQVITLVFSKSMNTSTTTLSGSMATASNGGAWSVSSITNDTLTIGPITNWSNGSGQNLSLSVLDLYGNISSFDAVYTVDAIIPTATPDPLSDSTINNSQVITVSFSEFMDEASLSLGGTMAANGNGGTWSVNSDTLTISPLNGWGGGTQTLSVNVDDLVGNSIALLNLSYTVDTVSAQATVDIASGSVISLTQAVTITFNEAMNPSTLQVTGSMSADSNGGVWSTGVATNDTLTIGPSPQWNEAPDQSLLIDVNDLAGNPTNVPLIYEANTNSIVFLTSVSGVGDLSTWPDAGGAIGLAAGDNICQTRANAAGLTGTFVAWLSDVNNDAYCRVSGLLGLVANNCDQSVLPGNAGPWVRTDGYPFSGSIDRLVTDNQVFTPIRLDETGTFVPYAQPLYFYAGTSTNGVGSGTSNNCGGWTDTTLGSSFGSPFLTSRRWSGSTFTGCNTIQRLACFESGPGIPLPQRTDFPAPGKTIFVTSTQGYGDLSTWTDAGGNVGVAAGDAICRARANAGGLANASNFKVWLSTSTISAKSRFVSTGPWVRPDGVPVANSMADLTDGEIFTSIAVDEFGNYIFAGVWTGTDDLGVATPNNCADWTDSASTATKGDSTSILGDRGWADNIPSSACNSPIVHLYCLED